MLPAIMEVAMQHGLEMNVSSSHSLKDARFKCPFCRADAGRKDKFYLSLNVRDNVFRCWACDESGGVLKFIALLEHDSIEGVKRKLWGNPKIPRKPLHPAERLTPAQLKAIGFRGSAWGKLKQGDAAYYQRTLNWVWQEWQVHVRDVKRHAYRRFLLALTSEEITAATRDCASEIGATPEQVLLEFTKAKFSRVKPQWAKSAEEWIALADSQETTISPERKPTGRDRRENIS